MTAPTTRVWVEDDLLRAGYTQCMNVLLPSRVLGASDKIVFFGVLSYAWQDNAAWPSIEMLTERVGLSRATVLRSLAELKQVGLLKVRRRGQGLVNFYEIPRITQAVLSRLGIAEQEEPDEEPPEDEDLVEIEDLTEAKGFTPLSNLILSARRLDAADKLLYVGLKSFAWRGRTRCRLKMRTLAVRTGMSERSVETHIGQLRAAGVITRRRRGLGRCNVYTLVRLHPAVLAALQEPRYVAPPLAVDNCLDEPLERCPVCCRRLPEPGVPLAAILTCQHCCSDGDLAGSEGVLNREVETSGSRVAELPFQRRGLAPSGGRRPAAPLVASLPRHEEDSSKEDSYEEGTGSNDPEGDVDAAGALWRATLADIAATISAAAFQTWFHDSIGISRVGNVLTVAAPHRFAKEWIDVRYRAEAEAALARAAGRPLDLVVEVVGRQRRPSALEVDPDPADPR